MSFVQQWLYCPVCQAINGIYLVPQGRQGAYASISQMNITT